MRVLVKGWYGEENLGDDLLFYEVMSNLDPLNQVTVVGNPRGLKIYEREFPNLRYAKRYSLKKLYLDIFFTDVLILGGGGLYPQINDSIKKYLDLILATILGKKIVILGIGINPKKGKLERIIWNTIAKRAEYFSVRDRLSLDLFKTDKVEMHHDLFFINNEKIKTLNIFSNVNKKLAFICLAHPFGNELVQIDYIVRDRYNKFLTEIRKAMEVIIKHNYEPVFIPFLMANDPILIKDLSNALGIENPRILNFNRDFSINEINSLFQKADFCFCMRFHAKVLAINNCKNFVGICYDFKSLALLDEVGLKDVGIRYGIGKEDFFGSEIDFIEDELKRLVEVTLNNKSANETKMLGLIKTIKESSRRNKKALNSIH